MKFIQSLAALSVLVGLSNVAAAGTPAELECEVSTSAQESVITLSYDPETRKHSATVDGVIVQVDELGQGVGAIGLWKAGTPIAIASGIATRQAPITLIGYQTESYFIRVMCGAKAN